MEIRKTSNETPMKRFGKAPLKTVNNIATVTKNPESNVIGPA